MPQSIQEMREDRNKFANQVRTLVNDHQDDQEWTNEHEEKYNKLVADVENLDKKIERHQKSMELEAKKFEQLNSISDRKGISLDEAHHQDQVRNNAVASWMRGGVQNLTEEQRESLQARMRAPTNALSTGTPETGGYLTDNEYMPQLVEAMKAYGGMREMATVISTETGSQMDFPTTDATSEEGEIVGESVKVSSQDTTFGLLSVNTFKYSSKSIAVPFELIQDSQIDITAYVNRLIAQRLGRITERHFTVGTGTGQPPGVVTESSVGVVGAAAAATTYEELVDLEHSVDPAYRMSAQCGYQFHDNTLRELRKLKDDNGRPLWTPGMDVSAPNQINGWSYRINQNMPVMASSAISIAFGDFSKYIIRDVMQVMLFRFTDSVYTEQGQVGFLAFMRTGGRLVDVGGAVKTFQNAA